MLTINVSQSEARKTGRMRTIFVGFLSTQHAIDVIAVKLNKTLRYHPGKQKNLSGTRDEPGIAPLRRIVTCWQAG